MLDVTAIGELLIDFSPYGQSDKRNSIFECNPGGAPANVLAACAKLGLKTAFIGKVGNDQFGKFLKLTIDTLEIESKGLIMDGEFNTTLAIVHLNDEGDRSFSFYRKPGADMMLTEFEVNYELIRNTKILHFGSVSMTSEPSRTATIKAVKFARENNKVISYDPNLRALLWRSLEEAKEVMLSMMSYCDVLKISQEELEFLTGNTDLDEGTQFLLQKYRVKLIFVTLGKNGCFYRTETNTGRGSAFEVNTIDTTGAGDSFIGAALYQIIHKDKPIEELTSFELDNIIEFASAMSALVTTQYGAIMSMPSIEQIYDCISSKSKRKK